MVENGYEPKQAEMLWVRPLKNGEFQLPWAAKVIEINGSKFKVSDEEGNICYIEYSAIIKELHPSDIKPVNDMINLYDLSEHSILRNIQLRYNENIIYVSFIYVLLSYDATNTFSQL
ncbi:unconventional myosin-VIIa-like [Halyomorpha halys]|uniref:unconventional myosin-VIIa-like n=1 Tax=Halyomorpha halys TaxID=286706 RepID=UPI0006D50D0F|nr:myosin-VIIa-like [Halyomorpha halys]